MDVDGWTRADECARWDRPERLADVVRRPTSTDRCHCQCAQIRLRCRDAIVGEIDLFDARVYMRAVFSSIGIHYTEPFVHREMCGSLCIYISTLYTVHVDARRSY